MKTTNAMLVLVLALCALALSPRDAGAQGFFLQGADGEGLDCTGSDCTLDGNLTITGDLDVAGTGTFDAIDVDTLTVQTSYWLPECPMGYLRNTSATAIVLCESGSDQMVKVGSFWIDRYEASLWSNASCSGTQYGASSDNYPSTFPDNGNWSTQVYACSISGVTPSRYLTWFQAQQACELKGKSLCTNEQWQAAAAGTYDPGSAETGTQCRIATTNTSPRNTGLAGTTPGGTTSCVSMWGAEDMIGNLWEWTAWWGQAGRTWQTSDGQEASAVWGTSYGNDSTWNVNGWVYSGTAYSAGLPASARRGGAWPDGSKAGVFAMHLSDGPSGWTSSTGARCCLR